MIPDDLGDEIGDRLIKYGKKYGHEINSAEEAVRVAYNTISDVDPKAANLWVVFLQDELS